jgi:hypothetical protein
MYSTGRGNRMPRDPHRLLNQLVFGRIAGQRRHTRTDITAKHCRFRLLWIKAA